MLVFKKKLDLNPDNYELISEVERHQLFVSYEHSLGAPAESIEAMFSPDNLDASLAVCEFYQVYDGYSELPIYDVWILNIISGTVFHSETIDDIGIGMIEGNFETFSSDDQSLANDLQNSFHQYYKTKPRTAVSSPDNDRDPYDGYQELVEEIFSDEEVIEPDETHTSTEQPKTITALSKPKKTVVNKKPEARPKIKAKKMIKSQPAKVKLKLKPKPKPKVKPTAKSTVKLKAKVNAKPTPMPQSTTNPKAKVKTKVKQRATSKTKSSLVSLKKTKKK
jgi:hypothetical protein